MRDFKRFRYYLFVLLLGFCSCGAIFNGLLIDASSHAVLFDSMGGTAVDSQDVGDLKLIDEPVTPLRDDFVFDGWYRSLYYSSEWDFGNDLVGEDMMLYAKWTEDFSNADKPSVQLLEYRGDSSKTYKLLAPWNYHKEHNRSRDYPLVIALHGYTPLTNHYYSPVIIGREVDMKEFPCFYLAPNNSTYGWSGTAAEWIRNLVVELSENYRIDTNRIYIIGFSMGGSGSYSFAEELYSEKGLSAAAIIRCAGMSKPDLPLALASRISIWYNVGLADDANIISMADSAYGYMKNLAPYEGAKENTQDDVSGGYNRTTFTLTKGNMEFMKLSQFTGLGHDDTPVWKDPYVLRWLFYQSLGKR